MGLLNASVETLCVPSHGLLTSAVAASSQADMNWKVCMSTSEKYELSAGVMSHRLDASESTWER